MPPYVVWVASCEAMLLMCELSILFGSPWLHVIDQNSPTSPGPGAALPVAANERAEMTATICLDNCILSNRGEAVLKGSEIKRSSIELLIEYSYIKTIEVSSLAIRGIYTCFILFQPY